MNTVHTLTHADLDTTPDNTNTTNVVATREGYTLHSDGELWTTGEHAFLCGSVSNPESLDCAIDNHEEEMRVLMAQAAEEFGL